MQTAQEAGHLSNLPHVLQTLIRIFKLYIILKVIILLISGYFHNQSRLSNIIESGQVAKTKAITGNDGPKWRGVVLFIDKKNVINLSSHRLQW